MVNKNSSRNIKIYSNGKKIMKTDLNFNKIHKCNNYKYNKRNYKNKNYQNNYRKQDRGAIEC